MSDRLRTISWCNNSHHTGVDEPVYELSTFKPNLPQKPKSQQMLHSIENKTLITTYEMHWFMYILTLLCFDV